MADAAISSFAMKEYQAEFHGASTTRMAFQEFKEKITALMQRGSPRAGG